jgi:hypothetical protein
MVPAMAKTVRESLDGAIEELKAQEPAEQDVSDENEPQEAPRGARELVALINDEESPDRREAMREALRGILEGHSEELRDGD